MSTSPQDVTEPGPAGASNHSAGCQGHVCSGTGPSRRAVIGGLALTVGVAGCGGAGDSGGSGDERSGSGDESDQGLEFSTSDVGVGESVYREEDEVILTQPSEGDFHAFDATCPHQGCQVSSQEAEELVCPCHGSRFTWDTGEVVSGPATSGLGELTVEVSGSSLRVSR